MQRTAMQTPEASDLYFAAAVQATERLRSEYRSLLPEGALSPDGTPGFDREMHELLHALMGVGMVQLAHLGDTSAERSLRAAVRRSCPKYSLNPDLLEAYEQVWLSGSDDLDRAARTGALLLSQFAKSGITFLHTTAKGAGGFLFGEAALLWQQVSDTLTSRSG